MNVTSSIFIDQSVPSFTNWTRFQLLKPDQTSSKTLWLRVSLVILSHYLPAFNMKRSAEENYFSSDEDDAWDHVLVRALDRATQLGGALGPLFTFRLETAGRRRRWRNVVDHAQFHAVLNQAREARPGDDLGVQLMEALYTAIRGQLASDARPHDLLHFAIHAHGFTHAFRSTNIRVEDFMDRDRYVDELLDTLAGKLNSPTGVFRWTWCWSACRLPAVAERNIMWGCEPSRKTVREKNPSFASTTKTTFAAPGPSSPCVPIVTAMTLVTCLGMSGGHSFRDALGKPSEPENCTRQQGCQKVHVVCQN